MPLSLKTKQVVGVTLIVGLAVVALGAWYLSSLAQVLLQESRARADLLEKLIYERARADVALGVDPLDPYARLKTDAGLDSILKSSVYSKGVSYAAIVDVDQRILMHLDDAMVGQTWTPTGDLDELLKQGRIAQTRAILAADRLRLETRQPLLLEHPDGPRRFATIHIGFSTLLIRSQFEPIMRTAVMTAVVALIATVVVAMLLAQLVVRPIHVIRSGLARLGRGELDVQVDLPRETELAELGDSFKAVTARLVADRSELADQRAKLESVVEHLEDAVALFAPDGTLLFANPAMRRAFSAESGAVDQLLPEGHPYRKALDASLATGQPQGPSAGELPGGGERLILTHLIRDPEERLLGVMIVSRNLGYLSQVESTLSYSRKLAAISRLSAGIAHEIKNPLNATMIHLELLKMRLSDTPDALEHLSVIAAQVRRLDEVVQGFLKFTRPEDMRLQPVWVGELIDELMPVIQAEASKSQVDVRVDMPPTLPAVSADSRMLLQAFLNLALNACQAMPQGGRLRIAARERPNREVEVLFEDTGVGISPEDLSKIFDLYFTTKSQGSGIGLSLVYRTIQLHDGDIEVQSAPGRGTTFSIRLRQAAHLLAPAVAAPAS
ncbi:MAG TPA: ATP-binding protein [Vicinamibacterales bacterium]|nr:ATP-binding protein [Vicinamibacterales bacterium]